YVPNWVRTTKYTAASFVPKNLYEQFRRVANIYFLFIVVLQVIPQVAQGNPFMSAFALCFILFITMVKDGYEDMKRHASDKELNSSQTERIGGNKWTNVNIGLVKEVGFFAKLFGNKSSNNGNDGDNNVAAAAARSSISYGAAHPMGSNVTNSGQVIGGSRALSKVHRQMSVETDEIHLTSLDHSSRQQQQHPRDMLRRMTFSNDESVNIGSSPQWMPVTWADVQVGDLLFLRSHDPIPADVAILATSEQDGTCFVETKQLDGETNLKPREALSNTRHLTSPDALREARFYLDSEAPNPSLYTYKGRLTVLNSDGSSTVEPVSINNMILRGCVLRNTEWIVALVVFTGIDTKIMLNAGETPSKRSRLEPKTNASYYIYGTIYNEKQYNVAFTIFLTFWTSLIVFQNIVPISLYVSIEIVKSIQAFFIHQDINMYYAPLDRRCIPRSWGLSDDLGQVEYIFSDKTGTLTQNIMEFRQCSIRGSVYGEVFFEAEQLEAEAESRKLSSINNNGSEKRVFEDAKREMISEMNLTFNNSYFLEDDCTFVDGKLYRDLRSEGSSKSRAIVEFFTILAVCHTVMAEYPNPDNSNIVTYQAQSPDEAALVSTARNVGFVFKGREGDVLNVEFLGQRQSFTLLHVLEFTSARKRMSVVVSKPDGQRVLFSKGADSIMYPRLRHGQDSLVNTTATHLEEFASSGLRTLVVGYRLVSDDEYSSWSVEFQNACSSLDDRDSLVDAAAEKIEHSLTLVGGTAIEDSLQEGVPESIAQLAMAGIKIWVLTGDKVETAINIGFSCRLLRDDMRLIIVAGKEPEHIRSQLKDALECFIQRSRDPSTANVRTAIGHQGLDDHPQHEDNDMPNALVIDGETLKYALDSELKALLLEVAKSCASVLCCRVSPLQKAQVVALVKDNLGALCLAIGDGANDVSMIQEADIGVGISGEEGLQAVMASDYAIARFRFLQRLLLVHGRWSYIRIANMILIFFYKNIVWTCAMFWFQIYTGFSLPLLYDYAFIMLYNLAFTAFPIIVLGVFDQDVSADVSMAVPQLFLRGLKNKDFTWWHFWLHVADALYQSAVCFFVPMFAYISTSSHWSGRDDLSLDEVGTVIASCIVIVVNTYVSVNSKNWTWMMPTVVALSIIVFFLFTVVYAQLTISGVYGVETMMFTTPIYYLVVFTTLFACLLPRMLFKYAKQTFLPNDNDLVRE
ncbi:phospholipid-translocating P-type ATPase, partial [Ramicandelaber brevisporus]